MALCPHCQGLLDEAAEICPNCGQPVKVADSPTAAPPPARGSLPLGDYFKTGWALFKQYPGGFIGFCLVYLAISIVLNSVPWVGWLASGIISSPLLMGNFIVSAKLLQRQPVQFGDFFSGFTFLLPLLLVSTAASVMVGIGLLLLVVPGIYLMVGFLFAHNLVVDRCLDFWPALDLSRRTVHPLWFGVFGFFLVLVLINLAGVLLLGFGLLVSVPLTFCALTAAYADIFGLSSDYSEKVPRLKQL